MIIALVLGLTLMLSACSSRNEMVVGHDFTTDISGLTLQENDSSTLIYLRPGAKHISTYEHFIIDPIRVNYSDSSVEKLTEEEVTELQDTFHRIMLTELQEDGYSIINHVAPNTMRLSFVLSSVKMPNAAVNVVGLLIPIALSVGSITIEATFKDATSNQINAVVVNASQGSMVLNATPWSTWADIESSFKQWAEGISKGIGQ